MPKRTFALSHGGPAVIQLAWRGSWKDLQVSYDGQPVGTIPDRRALEDGRAFPLPDGTELHVQLVKSLASAELQVTRDGEPLPGSASDPRYVVQQAAGMLYFIGGLNAVLGVVASLGDVSVLQAAGLGWWSVAVGAVYAGLGLLVQYARSKVALAVGATLFVLDGLFTIYAALSTGGAPPIGPTIARVFFVLPMIRGFGGLRALELEPPPPLPAAGGPAPPTGDPWQGPSS